VKLDGKRAWVVYREDNQPDVNTKKNMNPKRKR
jgi:hypothetical protein